MTRYIDADAIIWTDLSDGKGLCYVTFLDKIKHMPTADAVPVRHGKWKKSGNWGRVYKCDQCCNYLDFDGVNAGRGSANYCPNCGARMDEE